MLKDDAFPTIVAAIEQGRTIFENIRRFIVFLLSGNLAEVLAVGFSIGAPLPLLPLQILFINLVLDVFPALALGVGETPGGIMERPPRDPKEPILTRRHWTGTALWGLLIAVAATSVFFAALGSLELGRDQAVTVAFLTFALARLWHVFNMRDPGTSMIDNEVVRNRWVWYAIALCLALVGAAAWMPGLTTILDVVPLHPIGWALILGGSLVPVVVGQMVLSLMPSAAPRGRRESQRGGTGSRRATSPHGLILLVVAPAFCRPPGICSLQPVCLAFRHVPNPRVQSLCWRKPDGGEEEGAARPRGLI